MFYFVKIIKLKNKKEIFLYIIDAHTKIMQIYNTNFENVFISKNNRLKIVQKYEKKNCYLINSKYINLIVNVYKLIFKN